MITTRLDNVAARACRNDRACIYIMKPLGEQDSRRLFFNRVFGSENVCSVQFKEIPVEILKKCGGLPLAIITIASLLACHEAGSSNEWESINNSLGAKFATKPTLEEMRGILNLSYTHLPIHLRPCFLYLGMYPEDRLIIRDDLVRQWIAEGFVCNLHGADLEDVAKSYFVELINRGLIQPEKTCYGDVITCRIHDMMLDLILSKSTEDNFISVAYKHEDMARFNSCEYKVRRLSLQSSVGGAMSKALATSMSLVRSYTQFGESKYMLPLPQFKYLRVLAFEFPFNWKTTIDLRATGHLFLLRYLKVSALSAEVALHAEIQGLVHLETLELHCRPIQRFPSDITCLANLFHLILPECTLLPEGIQNMKSVRTLHCSDMSESSLKEIKGLSELTNLKELKLRVPTYYPGMTIECFDALLSSIGMLRNLKHLSLECWHKYDGYDS
uniref:NB-ARC domain-containing protein n=1 Tax=Triticum urartu TaxID=4572 RepID=A0A8R7UH49_TRIUA